MKKIKIGICDDQPLAVKQLETVISKYLFTQNINAELLLFQNEKEALPYIDKIDIFFLDIEMADMSEIEVERHIRQQQREDRIIIATGKIECFKEAFKIEAFRFVSKPFMAEEIEAALGDALKYIIGTDSIELYENRILYTVQHREIYFVKAYDGYVEAIIGNRRMRRDMSLTELENLLDKSLFYRVNRTYLINLLHITNYQQGTVFIHNEQIKVARVKKKDFEKMLREFDVKY